VTHSASVPEPRSTAPSSVHATPDPLRFAPVSRTLAQCSSLISEPPSECISTRSLNVIAPFRSVQANVIPCGFLELESRSFWLDTIPLSKDKAASRATSAQLFALFPEKCPAKHPPNVRALFAQTARTHPGNVRVTTLEQSAKKVALRTRSIRVGVQLASHAVAGAASVESSTLFAERRPRANAAKRPSSVLAVDGRFTRQRMGSGRQNVRAISHEVSSPLIARQATHQPSPRTVHGLVPSASAVHPRTGHGRAQGERMVHTRSGLGRDSSAPRPCRKRPWPDARPTGQRRNRGGTDQRRVATWRSGMETGQC
jgi:hypothetical protein